MARDLVIRRAELLDGKKSGKLSRKKILIFSDWYEPGFKAGGPIRSVRNFVEAMAPYYDISIVTSDRDFNETRAYPGIESNRWLDRTPGIKVYYANPEAVNLKLIQNLLKEKEPDFIYLNSLYSSRFSILPLILKWRNIISSKIILSPRGMLQKGAMQIKPLKKKLFIQLLNFIGLPGKIHFHATDEQEAADIREYFPKAKSVTEIFNFSSDGSIDSNRIDKIPGQLRLVYISRISPKKNLNEFMRWLVEIPESVNLSLEIYGEREDENYWGESKTIINDLLKNIQVKYLGSIPHQEVNQALAQNHIFVLPTRGENYGHAIAEAFSAGRPVMTSNKTPWRALYENKIGWDLSLENKKAWIDAVMEAAAFNQTEFDLWSENCKVYARAQLNNADLTKAYQKLFS